MNIANLELCKELYELSGWQVTGQNPFEGYYAYDLGYLLRKLYEVKRNLRIEHNHSDMKWYAYFAGRNEFTVDVGVMPNADTPEDAACKLAIELIKQGIINAK